MRRDAVIKWDETGWAWHGMGMGWAWDGQGMGMGWAWGLAWGLAWDGMGMGWGMVGNGHGMRMRIGCVSNVWVSNVWNGLKYGHTGWA